MTNGITATIFTSMATVKNTVTSRGRASYHAVRAAMMASATERVCVAAGDDAEDHHRIEADHGGGEASLGRTPSTTESCRQEHGGHPAHTRRAS